MKMDARAWGAPETERGSLVKPNPMARVLVPIDADLDALQRPHGAFDSTSKWHLTPMGLSLDGRPPKGTPGEPFTASQAFAFFGQEFRLPALNHQASLASCGSPRPQGRGLSCAWHRWRPGAPWAGEGAQD